MPCYITRVDEKVQFDENGHGSFPMLGCEQGCEDGCCAGISYYESEAYTPIALHEDQEGFYVISGEGFALVGDEEFFVVAGTAFMVPRQTNHQLRTKDQKKPLQVFWFHAK